MKNFLIYIVVSSAISITSGLVYAKYYLSPRIKDLLQAKASELLGTPVQIRDLRVLILPKLSLAATGVKFTLSDPSLKVDIAKLYIDVPINRSLLSKTIPFGPVQIRIEEPRFNFEKVTRPAALNSQDPQTITHTQFKFGRDFDVNLKVEHAKVKLTQISTKGEIENESTLDPIDFEVKIPGIEKDWAVTLKTRLTNLHPILSLPIELDGVFTLKDQVLSLPKASGKISGIAFDLTGEQKFLEDIGSWKLTSNILDFSKLKTPPTIEQFKNWKGSLKTELSATLISGGAWQFFGKLNAKSLSVDVNLQRDNLIINGPLIADGDLAFSYFDILKIDHFKLHANLNNLDIKSAGLFNKPKQVPMGFSINLIGRDQVLNILDLSMDFINLKAIVNGNLSFSKDVPSEVKLHIDPTSLSGWEKYISFFSSAPLTGRIGIDATIRGNQASNWSIDINSLKLEAFRAAVAYASKSPLLQIAGQIEADANINGPYGTSNYLDPIEIRGTTALRLSNFQFSNLKSSSTEVEMPSNDESTANDISKFFYWPKIKSSNFKFETQIGRFTHDRLAAESIASVLNLNDQMMSGYIKIAKIDSGEIYFSNIKYDMKETMPLLLGQCDFKSIDSSQFLTSIESSSTGLLKGDASGQFSFNLPFPAPSDWLSSLKLNGLLKIKNALFSNRGMDELLNEKLAQIPGIGKPKPATINSSGSELSVLFGFSDAILNVTDFRLLTPARNELQAKGTVLLPTQKLNLNGTAFLADTPIGGDVKLANSDTQGRFIVPFSLSGTLTKPETSFAEASIQEILKKTLYFVAKRETDKIKDVFLNDSKTKLPEKKVQNQIEKQSDPEDVEEQYDAEEAEAPKPSKARVAKPAENKIEALKNRLQGIFEKHE